MPISPALRLAFRELSSVFRQEGPSRQALFRARQGEPVSSGWPEFCKIGEIFGFYNTRIAKLITFNHRRHPAAVPAAQAWQL
jgi:hypothetical protein